jgi:hypothetical protein
MVIKRNKWALFRIINVFFMKASLVFLIDVKSKKLHRTVLFKRYAMMVMHKQIN